MPGKVVDGEIGNGGNGTRHKQERSNMAIARGDPPPDKWVIILIAISFKTGPLH